LKISELAKKIKKPAKVLLIQIIKMGIAAKTVQSPLTDKDLDKVLKALGKKDSSLDIGAIKSSVAEKAKPKKATAKKPAKTKKETTASSKPKLKAKTTVTKKEKVEKPKKVLAKKAPALKKVSKVKEEVSRIKEPAVKLELKKFQAEPIVKPEQDKPKPQPTKQLQLKLPIIIKDFADKMSIGPSLLIKELIGMGVFATINQLLDEERAKIVAEKFGFSIERLPSVEEAAVATHKEEAEDEKNLLPRPPVVTFMGHVDHGKTSLLDYIRKTKVTDSEKGGITQHIGAYEVTLKKGKISFLDTPGHAAFTAMRARGANATDIVVLVVAADDGLMPQTIEAIDHARAADVPIVVAINKVDKPNVDIDRVKKQLSEVDLMTEDWGGKTIAAHVSAITGEGIDNLLDMIILEAEMLELKANPNKPAKGVVVEAHISKGGGPIATVLVQNGTLCQGDIVVAGAYYGKVRALLDDRIHRVDKAPPSKPVEILGLNGVAQAGEAFMVVADEKTAKDICSSRTEKAKEDEKASLSQRVTLEDLYTQIQQGQVKDLKVILKTDVRGSLEAVADSLDKLSTKNMSLNIIHKGIGDINESDVLLAAASNAIILGFHVRKTPEADKASRREHVDTRLYSIIYEAVSDIKAAMEGLLEPDIKEVFAARILIKQVFKLSRSGMIAGSLVQKGKVIRNISCRLLRDNEEIYKGKLSSLKRFKDDVKEVAEGYECGIALEGFRNYKEGDIVECFNTEKIARRL